MNIISLFSGCGGMDLGFHKAGFDTIWANDNASSVWETYEKNFPQVYFDKRSLTEIDSFEIPTEILGVIGGPPCQSWSSAGNRMGFDDSRGQLFNDFIRIVQEKKPLFFVAENVQGLFSERNKEALENIKQALRGPNNEYKLTIELVNSADFGVPQNRKRIFFVGYRKDTNLEFTFPKPHLNKINVRDAIWDLRNSALPGLKNGNTSNGKKCKFPNHEYWVGDYSYIFMSRNRVLSWDSQSYTIQASGRQTSIHPNAPKMEKVSKDVMRFVQGKENLYRRLSIRECARIQTFPDNFEFYYNGNINSGYKMIGNAVPVNLAFEIAKVIKADLLKLHGSGEEMPKTWHEIKNSSTVAV
jgi:DNA (cytosine-5)-methyltransferase 1